MGGAATRQRRVSAARAITPTGSLPALLAIGSLLILWRIPQRLLMLAMHHSCIFLACFVDCKAGHAKPSSTTALPTMFAGKGKPMAREQYCDPADYFRGQHAACFAGVQQQYEHDVLGLRFGSDSTALQRQQQAAGGRRAGAGAGQRRRQQEDGG